jgi:acyl carrier protein
MIAEQQILDRLLAQIRRLAPPGAEIRPDITLVDELGLDSIKVMDLLMELEDEFDVSIPLNVLTDVRTPAQLAQAVFLLMEHADGAVR